MTDTHPEPPLPSEAARRIEALGLAPHPEGGWYRRIHTGTVTVRRPDDGERPGVTLIHYLLPAGAHSAWHRVDGDEIWHYLDGDPLTLWQQGTDGECRSITLGPAAHAEPVAVIPAGAWQAAVPNGRWTLTACAVGPGFDFAGFTLLREHEGGREWLRTHAPQLQHLL
ncbi:cupin domain-containing protein [Aquisalimonas sp.]|uniref:cupin domain-containing protein n=1 Tax=unclassified Aquisalimonas TaxID=2644645 RepID=UPI0025C6D763|nr:cupin domain-containing protein [Aquisalimonas sp.]